MRGILNASDEYSSPEDNSPLNADTVPKEEQFKGTSQGSFLQPTSKLATNLTKVPTRADGFGDHSAFSPDTDDKKRPYTPREHSSTKQSVDFLRNDFHVFTWLNAYKITVGSPREGTATTTTQRSIAESGNVDIDGNGSWNINEQYVKECLEEIHQFLSYKINLNERLSYQECPQQTRRDIYNMLAMERKEITSTAGRAGKLGKVYERKVDIVNAADSLFQFFLPSRFDGPTVRKYWGALHLFLVVSNNQLPFTDFFPLFY